jgi:hypothetical protein
MSASHAARWEDEEYRASAISKMMGNQNAAGYKFTEEQRAKISGKRTLAQLAQLNRLIFTALPKSPKFVQYSENSTTMAFFIPM